MYKANAVYIVTGREWMIFMKNRDNEFFDQQKLDELVKNRDLDTLRDQWYVFWHVHVAWTGLNIAVNIWKYFRWKKYSKRPIWQQLLHWSVQFMGIWSRPKSFVNMWNRFLWWNYISVMNELKNRGVKDVLIICADGLTGIKEAIATVFPKTEYQRCIVHQVKNTLKYVPDKDRKSFATDLKTIYQAADEKKALAALDHVTEKWTPKYPNSMKR